MKKILMPLALVLAVAGAFASRQHPSSANYASAKVDGQTCQKVSGTRTDCALTGPNICHIGTTTYYIDDACNTALFRP